MGILEEMFQETLAEIEGGNGKIGGDESPLPELRPRLSSDVLPHEEETLENTFNQLQDEDARFEANLPWEEVAKRAYKNFLPDTLNVIKGVASFIQPVATNPREPFALAPGLQTMARLAKDVGVEFFVGRPVGGKEPSSGRIDSAGFLETPVLDSALQYYKENWGLGPEGVEGLKRYIAEEPAQALSDLMTIASLGAGAVEGTAKAAAASERVAARLGGQRFLMSTAAKAEIGRKVFDFVDPAALPVNVVGLGLEAAGRGMQRAIASPESALDQRIIDLEKKYGLDLPASAKTDAPNVALMEALAVKLGDEQLRLKVVKAHEDLSNIAQQTILDLQGSTDMAEVGAIILERQKAARAKYEEISGALYAEFEKKGGLDLPASTDATFTALSEIAARKSQVRGGIASATGDFEGLLTDLEQVRGETRLGRDAIQRESRVDATGETVFTAQGGVPQRSVFGKDPSTVYKVRYKVVNLDDLIPSQLDSGAPNPNFPKELQPRDRTRLTSQAQINEISNKLAPDALLADVPTLNRGAPIVGADNVVESGNGRTLALRRARVSNPQGFTAYQQRLREVLPNYGIDPETIAGMNAPVLVRERLTDVDRTAFVREAVEGGLELSPLERAFNDTRIISDDSIAALAVAEGETIFDALAKPKNNDFVSAFIRGLDGTERAALLDSSGKLNRSGVERLKNSLIAKTYTNGLLESLIESTDIGIKNIEKALLASLPEMSQSEALIRQGMRAKDLSIAHDAETALNKLRHLRAEGTSVSDYLAQQTLIADDLSDTAKQLLPVFEKGVRSPKVISEFLRAYASEVGRSKNLAQESLFGEIEISKEMILAKLIGESFEDAPNISAIFDEFVTKRQAATAAGEATTFAGQAGAPLPEGGQAIGKVKKEEKPLVPWTFDSLKQTRSEIGAKINNGDPVVKTNEKLYKSLYAALSEDMNATVAANAPELAPVISQAASTFKEGTELLNSEIGKKIWRKRESPSAIAPMVLSRSTSLEDISRMKKIVGDEAWRNVQAATLDSIFGKSKNQAGNWRPVGLHTQLKTIGNARLREIFDPATAEALVEISEISASFGKLSKITEGSQTNFLQRVTGSSALFLVANQFYGLGAGGGAALMASWVGDAMFRKWIVSDAGQAFLLGQSDRVGRVGRGVRRIGVPASRGALLQSRIRQTESENTRRE